MCSEDRLAFGISIADVDTHTFSNVAAGIDNVDEIYVIYPLEAPTYSAVVRSLGYGILDVFTPEFLFQLLNLA